MSNMHTIRQKALRAALAVTMSASVAAAGCSDDTTTDDDGWEVGEQTDASNDAQIDTGRDVAADVAPDVRADTGATCSTSFDDICPSQCNAGNDADCCEQTGGWWSEGGGCAVPGPFVPPAMSA